MREAEARNRTKFWFRIADTADKSRSNWRRAKGLLRADGYHPRCCKRRQGMSAKMALRDRGVSMEIKVRLQSIAREYPNAQIAGQLADVDRIAFNISLVPRTCTRTRIADIGGGLGLFGVGCAALDMDSTVVDDFLDPGNVEIAEEVLKVHARYGVAVIRRDVVKDGVDFMPNSFDVISSFDSIEHWHHSPKRLFKQLVAALKPGGTFILGAPNCVNLRKRITVPLGYGKWSQLSDWYDQEIFRAHVREPDVGDMRYISSDLGLVEPKIIGRNWLGYQSSRRVIRIAAAVFDVPLRLFPSLCSDLYLIANKPG